MPPQLQHSAEAELGIIGCLLTGEELAFAAVAAAGVHAGQFFDLRHRRAFSECLAMHANGETVSVLTVSARLKTTDASGDWCNLLTTAANWPISAHECPTLCGQLVDQDRRRVAQDMARRISEAACSPECRDILTYTQQALESFIGGFCGDGLPPLVDASEFVAEAIPEPPQLVRGILHQGSKLVLGGGSKSYKTWCLLDLAVSVAHGLPWLGKDSAQGPVLFLNFEVQAHAFQRRIADVAHAKGITIAPGAISIWNLRGHAADFRKILPRITRQAKAKGFVLIVLDPIYKLYGGADENSAGDIAALLNGLERLAVDTGAATAFGAHFAKGNASQKEAIDRISGSGVFARDPDTLLMLTKHEEADAFTVEAILRNFAPVAPFAVRWKFPLMRRDNDLDPARLKRPGGRKPEHSSDELLKVLPNAGLSNADWKALAEKQEGIKERSFFRVRKQLETAGKVMFSSKSKKWQPVNPQHAE